MRVGPVEVVQRVGGAPARRAAEPGVPVLGRMAEPAAPVTVELGYRLVPLVADAPWAYRVAGPQRLVWGFSSVA